MTYATIALLSLLAPAQLGIGDKAPPLSFGEVLKGSPIRSFSSTKATVVEFWATWCGPCIELMPHLSELYRKYRDQVDFVSVSIMENDYSKVRPFVESMGDKIAYPVAIDQLDAKGQGSMHANWLMAAGQTGIPVAFVVDSEARIAWIGHPSNMDAVLVKVIDGSWDAKSFHAKFEAKRRDEAAASRFIEASYEKILSAPWKHRYNEVLAWLDRNQSKYFGESTQAAIAELKVLFAAFKSGDFEGALRAAETGLTNPLIWAYFQPMLIVARIDAMQRLGKTDEWRKIASNTIEGPPDPNILMNLVRAFAHSDSKLKVKDADVALKAGEKLARLARVPMFLVELAWAQYASGQVEKAKATLEEAFAKMPEEQKRNPQYYEGTMAKLKAAKAHFDKGKR